MTFLPIVERELRVAARLPATYRNRALSAGVVAAVAVVLLLFGGSTRSHAVMGMITFRVLSYLTLVFCLVEGARKTADCVSEEKREGTLGLLFLTDLKGYDVVFGKLAANSLNSIYCLLAILPVLGLPLLAGGVTPGEYWRVALALVNILLFSLCAGMCVSVLGRGEQQAVVATLLLVAALSALPLLARAHFVLVFSPVHAFLTAFDADYAGDRRGYWESAGLTQLWSWLMLAGSCLIVPHSWQARAARTTVPSRWRARNAEHRARLRTEMMEINPVYWLAGRNHTQRTALHGFIGITAVAAVFIVLSNGFILPKLMAGAWLLNLFIKMRMAMQAAHCLAEARHNHSLELLVTSPLTTDQIINGQIRAMQRMFTAPLITVVSLEFIAVVIWTTAENQGGRGNAEIPLAAAGYFLGFALDVVAVTWTGMWFGLTSKKESHAAFKTILWVLVAPAISLVCWCPGLLLYIGWPIFCIHRAKEKVREEFDRLAARRYALNPVQFGAGPGIAGASRTTPPPLPGRTGDRGGSRHPRPW